jgi:protease PrsW
LIERQLGFGPGHLTSSLGVAVVEEFAKAIAIIWLLRKAAFRFKMDGILFGAAAAMGFAALENALYALARLQTVDEMLAVLTLRSVLAPFGHGAWTALVCAAIWGQRRSARPGWRVLASFGAAVLLHTLWDWRPLPHVLGLAWVLVVAALGIVALRMVIEQALREEARSVSALNPGTTGALGPMRQCGACGQIALSGLRYCPRCGVALRVGAA